MPKVRVEEWSTEEVAEACSFRSLIDRMYSAFQSDEEGGMYSFSRNVKSGEDFKRWQRSYRKKLIESLGIKDMLQSRTKIELVRSSSESHWDKKTYSIEKLYVKSWMDTLIPILLCVPRMSKGSRSRIPAMICAHGHLMRKENLAGKKRNLAYRGTWARDFAIMGCITVSMDQWGFGERGHGFWNVFRRFGKYYVPEGKYAQNMLQFGRTILGLRAFDAVRLVDYLLKRGDVDSKRIGIAGLSMGGLVASTVAAIDPRVGMGIVAGYLCTYKDSIIDLAKKHCADMYVPGMFRMGEEYDLLSLIAPRPICFIAGRNDGIFPFESAEKAFKKVKKAYRLLGAKDNCVCDAAPIGHSWRGDVAYEFVKEKWF